MTNPFDTLDQRLSNIEAMLLDLKNAPKPAPAAEPEYVDELKARTILGGGTKPLSKSTFYNLREAGHFQVYHPSPGRSLYKLTELYAILHRQSHAA